MRDLEILEMLLETSVFKCMKKRAIEFTPLKRKEAYTYDATDYDAGVVVLDINVDKGRVFVIAHELSHNKHNDNKYLDKRAMVIFGALITPIILIVHYMGVYLLLALLLAFLYLPFRSYYRVITEFRCDRESILALKELGMKSEMLEVFEYFENYKPDPEEEEGYSLWSFLRGRCTHPPTHLRVKRVLKIENSPK